MHRQALIREKGQLTLHVVEGLEERGDERGSQLKEARELVLESIVVELVLLRGDFEVLFDLEHVLQRHPKKVS